ncbi:MAG: alpha/beta fold hydrolase [Ketobacteraceae bacterium]|nr:alpha/beta fold hydrolase [Ketobacteraceae bacterium]
MRASLPDTQTDSTGQHPEWHGPARFAAGLFSLLLRTASEVSRIAGEIHGVVRHRPRPLGKTIETDPQQIPRFYQLINMAFIQAANQLHKVTDMIPAPEAAASELARMQSIINGVFGDKLEDWGHPAAIQMHWLDRNHSPTTLQLEQKNAAHGVAVFIHGLCLSEKEWSGEAAQMFCDSLNQQGYGVVLLRYNSGLSLSENGERLAHLLDREWQTGTGQRLLIFGHSMGGLVARSALHFGRDVHQQTWVDDVSHGAYIASPHEGANLEKLGDFVNSLLGYSPYTKPLMALGNIRSRGVRSLKVSRIHHEDMMETDHRKLFNDRIHQLLVGARLPAPAVKAVLGDGLVTDTSAMAMAHFPEEHQRITRLFINEVGHLRLLRDQRLYSCLALWLHHTGLQH